jgi:hypothetical protein
MRDIDHWEIINKDSGKMEREEKSKKVAREEPQHCDRQASGSLQ